MNIIQWTEPHSDTCRGFQQLSQFVPTVFTNYSLIFSVANFPFTTSKNLNGIVPFMTSIADEYE